jgi:ABC-type nitrate/sulfonate/bicarbonate transport system substrate-binding protein/outer membrane protein OmpA-like peptidoglycan-associated protein
MKRAVLGILILLIVVGAGLAYKFILAPGASGGGGGGDLTFAKVENPKISVVGGYSLSTVDLGEGPVPLLRIPLDTWGGYASLFAANGGIKPSKDSLFYKRGKFAVELVPEESSQAQLDGYAAGKYPLIWAPMDSLPLLYDALKSDKRVVPRVLGLFDWSAGGDGIVVRDSVKRASDLKGQIVLTSSNTPFSFLLLWYLAQNGLTGQDVKVVYLDDGPKALKLFKSDKRIAAWVTWTPFLTDVVQSSSPSYVAGARALISSRDANQLIADAYIVRNDLFQDKGDMMAAFCEAMMEGSKLIADGDGTAFNAMAAFYKLPNAAEAKAMLSDVHLANFPENQMFFDENNPIGAQKIFLLSQEYYKQLGALGPSTSYEPDRVLGTGPLQALAKKGLFADQKNTIRDSFNKKASFDIGDLESQRVVLTNSIQLWFEAQKLDFDLKSDRPEIKENISLLGKVAEQTSFLGTTVVKLVGYLDTTKVADFKAQGNQAFIEASAQAKLISKKRAEFIKSVLVTNYKVDPQRIVTEGRGWDNPIDDKDPTKNRRVEVKFISLE